MKEGLEAFNALVDKVLAYRPKQKTKKTPRRVAKAMRQKNPKPKKRG